MSKRRSGNSRRPRVFARMLMALGVLSLADCGAALYQPSASTTFELDPAVEVDDDDVLKAFQARPQMPENAQIAYYSFDPTKADALDATLTAMPGVRGTYRIPSLLLTGQRRFETPRPWDPPVPLSIKKLRLLAARAHCELLVILDSGHRVTTTVNGLVAFDLLLLPALFMPFLDVEVSSATDAFVIDVRNGYLYAHVAAQQSGVDDYVTIYSADGGHLLDAQWPRLLDDTAQALRKVLSERGGPPAVSAPGDTSTPALAAPAPAVAWPAAHAPAVPAGTAP